jgi:hypothetical protein
MRCAALAGLLVTAAAARAGDPPALRSLFPDEADVYADAPGLTRIDLPPEILAACLPGLADLRLFDTEGNEIPFLLDSPRAGTIFEKETLDTKPAEVAQTETPREHGPSLRRETYTLAGPTTASRGGTWTLVVTTAVPTFVAHAHVTWDGGSADGSMFRLSSPRPAEKLSLPLAATAPGRVTITLEHEQASWLTPSFRFESDRTIDHAGKGTIPLAIVGTRSAHGTTVVDLARPRGVVPEALRFAASTPTFDRTITVNDGGPRHAGTLASGSVFRLDAQSGVEELDLPVQPAHGDRLRVSIDDGDSPPLAGLSVTAVFGQPSLVASLAPSGGVAPAAILRFGGGRANVPRYDLAAFGADPGRELYGKRAEALVRIYDPAATRAARLGPIRPNPAFDRTPALEFAMRPGAAIDAGTFARRRPVRLAPSPEGLSRVRLDAADLAALSSDLADLRIVDGSSRQWPYLLERGDGSIESPLAAAVSTKDRRTTYRLTPAVSPLTANRLAIDADVPFFDRAFKLAGVDESGHDRVIAAGRLARATSDPMPVAIDFPSTRLAKLALTIEDGDDAPLPLRSFIARVPVPDVFVAAPAGSYALLLGSRDTTAPSYELARVRDVVLSVAAGDAEAGPIEKNPGLSLAARITRGKGAETTILWVALIAAVVVLGTLTLRLARK